MEVELFSENVVCDAVIPVNIGLAVDQDALVVRKKLGQGLPYLSMAQSSRLNRRYRRKWMEKGSFSEKFSGGKMLCGLRGRGKAGRMKET